MPRINFVELPARDIAAARRFYADAFGMALIDFGPTYAYTISRAI